MPLKEFKTDVKTELDVIARRKLLEKRREQFDAYNTQMDIKRFEQIQKAQAAAQQKSEDQTGVQEGDKTQKLPNTQKQRTFLNFGDTKLPQTIDPGLEQSKIAQQLHLSQKLTASQQICHDESSSTDIELPEVVHKQETMQQMMEHIKNQCMMEKEDKYYIEAQKKKQEQVQQYKANKKSRHYQKMKEVYEDILACALGEKDISEESFEKFFAIKDQIQEDVYMIYHGESFYRYKKQIEGKLTKGIILREENIVDSQQQLDSKPVSQPVQENQDDLAIEHLELNTESQQINEDQKSQENQTEQQQSLGSEQNQTIVEKEQKNELTFIIPPAQAFCNYNNVERPNVSLLLSYKQLETSDYSYFGQHRCVYLKLTDDFQEWKAYFTQILDKIKTIQKEKKGGGVIKLPILDSKMIVPTVEADKFIKAPTNEQVIAARINYLIMRQSGQEIKIAGADLIPIDEDVLILKQQKLEEEKLKAEEAPEQPKSASKQQRKPSAGPQQPADEEPQFSALKSKYYVSNIIVVVDNYKVPKPIVDLEQALAFLQKPEDKAKVEQNVKAKYASLAVSMFDRVFYHANPEKQVKIVDVSQAANAKGKGTDKKGVEQSSVDQNQVLAQQIVDGCFGGELELNNYQFQVTSDENIQALQALFKDCGNILRVLDGSEVKTNKVQIRLEQTVQNCLKSLTSSILDICELDEVDNTGLFLIYLFSRDQIQNLVKYSSGMLKEQLFGPMTKISMKIHNFDRLLLLRTLKYRDSGIQLLLKEIQKLRQQFIEVLTENQVVKNKSGIMAQLIDMYTEAHQTELENLTHIFRETNEIGQDDLKNFYRQFMCFGDLLDLLNAVDPAKLSFELGKLQGWLLQYYTQAQLDVIVKGQKGDNNYQQQLTREIISLYKELIDCELLPTDVEKTLFIILNQDWSVSHENGTSWDSQVLQTTLGTSTTNKNGQYALKYLDDHTEVEAEDVETVLSGILAWAQYRMGGSNSFLINYEAEFRQVGIMLSTQYQNSAIRLQQLLKYTYKLILRSATSKSTYQLLDDVDRYSGLLRAELNALRQVSDTAYNQLNLKQADAEEYKPLANFLDFSNVCKLEINSVEDCKNLLQKLKQSGRLDNQLVEEILQKLEINSEKTQQLIKEQFCIHFAEVTEEADTSKGAKKGAMIRIETPKCFYFDGLVNWCAELRSKQLSIDLKVLSEIIVDILKKANVVIPTRPQSSAEQAKDKKAAEAAKAKEAETPAVVETPAVELRETEIFETVQALVTLKQKQLIGEHSTEFIQIFIKDFITSLGAQKCSKSDAHAAIIFYLSLLASPATQGEHILVLKKLFGLLEQAVSADGQPSNVIDCAANAIKATKAIQFVVQKKFLTPFTGSLEAKDLNNIFGDSFQLSKFQEIVSADAQEEKPPEEAKPASRGPSAKSTKRK